MSINDLLKTVHNRVEQNVYPEAIKEPVAEATQPAQQAVVSELEEFLDLLTWSGVIGAIKLKLVLYGYSIDHGKEGLKQEFEKFTPAGKQKYGKFFTRYYNTELDHAKLKKHEMER